MPQRSADSENPRDHKIDYYYAGAFCDYSFDMDIYNLKHQSIALNDENIGFDMYIGTWISLIYRKYIGGYFYINFDN